MENNLFDRLTPEMKVLFNKHDADYPATSKDVKIELKNNWLLIEVSYGTILGLESMVPLGVKISPYQMFTGL